MNTIVIITPYTNPSACGIWQRAFFDAKSITSKNTKINFISSNIEKGTNNILSQEGSFGNYTIHRKKVWLKLGGTSMFFFFWNTLRKINPDIIHVHGYRHPHSLFGLIQGKLMRKTVFLTAHAPFEKDPRRSILLKLIDILYDLLIGWWQMRLYDKIILTTKWEEKYLRKLGANDTQLVYAPNGIAKEFFEKATNDQLSAADSSKPKADSRQLKAFYMGRLDPVKRLEWILAVAKDVPEIQFTIYGPLSGYDSFESDLPNVQIIQKKYTAEEFIQFADTQDVYILPSARESFGMTLVEAMARGCVPVSSDTRGAREIIEDGVNGFLVKKKEKLKKELIKLLEVKGTEQFEALRVAAKKRAGDFSIYESQVKMAELYSQAGMS